MTEDAYYRRSYDTVIYLVRHGQTAENLMGIIQGQMDTVLDETGVEQARSVAQYLSTVRFDIAFSSDLRRASETARMILEHHPDVPLNKLTPLRERDMGKLQGHPIRKDHRPRSDDSVETLDALTQRALRFWNDEIIPYSRTLASPTMTTNLLVVSHGGFISTLTRELARKNALSKGDVSTDKPCGNSSVTTIELDSWTERGRLCAYGDMRHWQDRPTVKNADEMITLRYQ
ncbi:hypothetical protein M422DRAFT_228313 [Sphaerobolus stellatus SS14]|uniref:Uncharacterized protein n=1 Tax=Sphaerobolus stellatus (strain SS14) TaxID=990650 RepID=A0A0C9W055_SPHS4|nr:hypothetical protein M422DRAFT_228313 [Sphaerobolus stellatus SS14]